MTLLGPTPTHRHVVADLVNDAKVEYFPRALGARLASLSTVLAQCDSLLHMNYRPGRAEGFRLRFDEEVHKNLVETQHLVDACELAGTEHVCFLSSALVYTPPREAAREDGPVGGGVPPYALVKLLQESRLRHWARRSGRPAALLRLTTVYGPGETVARAIPNFIRAALSGGEALVNRDLDARFDPVHVDDVAEAIVTVLARPAGGTFNIGTGRAWSPGQVAALVNRLCAGGLESPRPSEGMNFVRPVVDVSLAATILGFKAAIQLEAGLAEEISWLRDTQLRMTA